MTQDFILCAYDFDHNGGGVSVPVDDIAHKVRTEGLSWVHLDINHEGTREWLTQNVDYIDTLIIDALLEGETYPRLTEHEDGMLIILRAVNHEKDDEPEDMISIRLWIDEHRIISTQRRNMKAIDDIKDKMKRGKGPKSAADFLILLVTQLFLRMESTLLDLNEHMDEIEEKILDKPDMTLRHNIIDLRRKAIILRRYIAPQRDVVAYLYNSDVPWIDTSHRRQLQESQDRIRRYIDDLDAIRERAQIVKDELANSIADRMNRNTYILSIVAAIFLPLTFLTGLLGSNVGGIPGSDSPAAFWIVLGICLFFATSLISFFKYMKWL